MATPEPTPEPTAPVPAGARGPRRGRVLAVGTVAAVVLAVGGGAWFSGYQEDRRLAEAALEERLEALEPVALELSQWIDASEVAVESARGRVTDERYITDMEAVLADAGALDTAPPEDGSPADRAAAAEETRQAALRHIAAIEAASADLFTDTYVYDTRQELVVYDGAVAALDQAVAAGEAALAGAGGDTAARDALRAALDAAAAARAVPVDREDIDQVIRARPPVEEATAGVTAATAAVTAG